MVPKGWICCSVGEACSIKNNVRLPLSSDQRKNIKGQYPYYGPTGVLDYINEYRIDEEFCLIGEDGDHFLKFKEKDMTLLINAKANVNNHAHIICASAKCIPSWFHYSFIHRDITSYLTRQGAKRYKLTKASLESLPILLPPLPEQRKIAQILSTWDKAIATTERLLANKQQQKKALMQRLLTGKQRFAGFEGEWREGSLSQFVGRIYGGGTPSRDRPEFWNGNIPWVTVKDLVSNTINGAQEAITESGLSESASNIVPAGTVIIATRMALGKAVIATCDVAINQDLKAISGSKFIDSVYLHYWLIAHAERISCLGTGSTVKGIQLADIKSLQMSIPMDILEQQKIASVLSSSDAELSTIQKQLDNLKLQKKALMQQLLTGKRRVKIDEVAA